MSTDTLIALVDGSAYAESVCHHAAWIAGRTGAGVKVYHVMGRRQAPDQQDLSGAIRLGARSKLLEYMKNSGIILVTERFDGGMPMPGSALEPKNQEKWLESVAKSPSPIRYSVQPIDRLLARLPCFVSVLKTSLITCLICPLSFIFASPDICLI